MTQSGGLSLRDENKAPNTKGETSKEASELKSAGKCGFVSAPQKQMQAGLPKSRDDLSLERDGRKAESGWMRIPSRGKTRESQTWWLAMGITGTMQLGRGTERQARQARQSLTSCRGSRTHLDTGILRDSKTGCHNVDKPWRGCQDPGETLFRQRRFRSPFRFTSAQMRCLQKWRVRSSCAHWCQKLRSVVCLTPLWSGTLIYACPRRKEDSACQWAAMGRGLWGFWRNLVLLGVFFKETWGLGSLKPPVATFCFCHTGMWMRTDPDNITMPSAICPGTYLHVWVAGEVPRLFRQREAQPVLCAGWGTVVSNRKRLFWLKLAFCTHLLKDQYHSSVLISFKAYSCQWGSNHTYGPTTPVLQGDLCTGCQRIFLRTLVGTSLIFILQIQIWKNHFAK